MKCNKIKKGSLMCKKMNKGAQQMIQHTLQNMTTRICNQKDMMMRRNNHGKAKMIVCCH